MITCSHDDCDTQAVQQWQRRVDDDTVTALFGCDVHKLDDDAAAKLHLVDCPAPNGPCVCP